MGESKGWIHPFKLINRDKIYIIEKDRKMKLIKTLYLGNKS